MQACTGHLPYSVESCLVQLPGYFGVSVASMGQYGSARVVGGRARASVSRAHHRVENLAVRAITPL